MRKTAIYCTAALVLGGCGKASVEQAPLPVKVKTMVVGGSRASSGGHQTYTGTIEEESGVALSFASIGTVERIGVSEGQFVGRGQTIATLNTTSARNAYDAALAAKEQALDAERRMKQLYDNGSLPEIKWVEVQTQVRQAQASEQIARKGLADTRLTAPFSGYISKKMAEPGSNVGPGVPVVQLVKIEQVKVKISVPESEIAHFAKGEHVQVVVEALGGQTFAGTIVEKGISADALSRTYEVKALVANPHHQLLPGMIAEVRIDAPSTSPKGESKEENDISRTSYHAPAYPVPANLIQLTADNRTFLWVVKNGCAERRFVALGENVGANVLITSGLSRGEHVISEGQQKVSTGMKVTE